MCITDRWHPASLGWAALLLAVGCGAGPVREQPCPPAESGLTGRVVSAESGRALTNVLVETEPPTDSDRTDARGCYAILLAPAQGGAAVPEGRYRMVLRAPPVGQVILVEGEPAAADYDLAAVVVEVDYDGDATELVVPVPRAATPTFEAPERVRPDAPTREVGPLNSRHARPLPGPGSPT